METEHRRMAPLERGRLLPSVELAETGGETVRFQDFRGRRSLVVFLAHPPGCPFCEQEARELSGAYPELAEAGAEVLAVVPASRSEAAAWKRAGGLPFPVLADEAGEMAGGAALAVVDPFGEIFALSGGGEGHALMGVEEIGDWLRFIEVQCPE